VNTDGAARGLSSDDKEEVLVTGKSTQMAGSRIILAEPKRWPDDPDSKAPRYCILAADERGGSAFGPGSSTRGWCFVVGCKPKEDGLIGLRSPDGDDICR
jgi:hypothetical protein